MFLQLQAISGGEGERHLKLKESRLKEAETRLEYLEKERQHLEEENIKKEREVAVSIVYVRELPNPWDLLTFLFFVCISPICLFVWVYLFVILSP